MARKTGKEMADQLSDFMNSAMSFEMEEFSQEVTRDHRALQEEMFVSFFKSIREWAEMYDKGFYDERNEYTCKMSYEMIKPLKDKGLI